MSVNPDVQEIIEYLESDDLEIVQHFKITVQEKLYGSRDHTLLGTLTDQYIQTKSDRILELLVAVNDTHAMYLFEKLNDHLKHGAHTEVCMLLFSIIRKQPSWLHKLVGTALFSTFLKCLKHDNDIVFIMSGLVILCTLLPCVPATIGSQQGDILDVFVRTAGLLLNKTGNIPEVYILHLHVSVYILFHRLYSMYPNNFLTYMKSCYCTKKKDLVFQQIIKPMFEFVKFHPDLITETTKSEAGLQKWKIFAPHDVLTDCQKISLDPVDSTKEASYIIFPQQLDEISFRTLKDSNPLLNLNSVFSHPDVSMYTTPKKDITNDSSQVSERKPILEDISAICNPGEICGMTTPPSSRPMSPSNSAQDISSLQCVKQFQSENDSHGSTQTLNELITDRKSSGETMSLSGGNQSPNMKRHGVKKTKSFGSSDNVNHKNSIKSWLPSSATHSTPIEKELSHLQQTGSASPRKGSNSKSQPKRPKSTEFFKHKFVTRLNLVGAEQVGVHSAPTSPMVHKPNAVNQFSFNLQIAEQELDYKVVEDHVTNKQDSARQNHQRLSNASIETSLRCNPSASQAHEVSVSLQLLDSIRSMFAELCPKPQKDASDANETSDQLPHMFHTQKIKSPLNLLDDFIQYGADIHCYQLSRIPLTSQLETDWTYYGGTTPVDELKIIQTQVYLLHTQLLYERYKSELHCLRNRRLFGSLQKSQAVQYELSMLKDQNKLIEKKLQEVKLNVKLKTDENRSLQNQAAIREQDFLKKIQELESQNKDLKFKLKKEKLKKKELKRLKEKLQKELNKAKHLLYETTQEVVGTLPKLKEREQLILKIETLEKELLVQSDKQERVKAYVEDFQRRNYQYEELERKLVAHRYELKNLNDEKDAATINVESLKVKLCELESSYSKKEKLIREHKNEVMNLQSRHKKEIEVLQERLESTQKTCQSLNSYIASLVSKLEDAKSPTTASTHSSQHHDGSRYRRSASYAGLEASTKVSTKSNHDHSHRHHVPRDGDENPFRSRSQASSISSVGDSLRKRNSLIQDSGVIT